jgi:SAM-dependent methyltransferase
VIHYGFHDYKAMLVKIGAHLMDRAALQSCAEFGIDGQGPNWILDERECACRKLPDSVFPPGCLPPDIWEEPGPKPIADLIPYSEISEDAPSPLTDRRAREAWADIHRKNYHGDYHAIHARNTDIWENQNSDPLNRSCLFKFDPAGKVVFDVACGGGWYMLDCLTNGAEKVIGFEVDLKLLRRARRSFKAMGIPKDKYGFIDLSAPLPAIPAADIIYCVAMFMHLPFWQACRYFAWINDSLKPGGEAHLQFYQKAGENWTMFWNGVAHSQGDNVNTIRLHHELERAGLVIKGKHQAEGEGILPVWQMYRCVKEAS